VAFTADSQTAVTSGLDGTIRFWDARTGGLKRPPIEVRGHVHSLAISPNSKTILVGGDRIAWFYDVESGRVRGEPLEHNSEVSVVAFLPAGSQAMTYSDEGVMRLWEVETGRPVGPPRTVGASSCRAFSPDGSMLLAGRADGTARLWDVATGHPLGQPLFHRSGVVSVAFRGDGRVVATGDDQAAHLWDAPEEVAGDPDRLLLWAEVITNQQFDAEGNAIRLMDAPTWGEHRRRLTRPQGQEDGSPPGHPDPSVASRQNLASGSQPRGGRFVRSVAFSSVHP
jgi:hypothetical protein